MAISAKMQPNDHISTGHEYLVEYKRISGALYHNVTTSCVYTLTGTPKARPRPKSATYWN